MIFFFQKQETLQQQKKFPIFQKKSPKQKKKKLNSGCYTAIQFFWYKNTNLNLPYGTEPGIAGGGGSCCCTLAMNEVPS